MSEKQYFVLCSDDCKYPAMTAEQIIAAIAEATGSVPTGIDDAFITKLKEIRAGNTAQLWIGTEADFNALSPKPTINKSPVRIGTDGVLYICTDDSLSGSYSVEAVLTADGWVDNVQTVTVSGMKANSNGSAGLSMGASAEQVKAAAAAMLKPTARAEGSLTITAFGTVPTIDLPIEILIVG